MGWWHPGKRGRVTKSQYDTIELLLMQIFLKMEFADMKIMCNSAIRNSNVKRFCKGINDEWSNLVKEQEKCKVKSVKVKVI